jgi:hypothetical protein
VLTLRDIRGMGRREIVEMLEDRYYIQCYCHESTDELREALVQAARDEGELEEESELEEEDA